MANLTSRRWYLPHTHTLLRGENTHRKWKNILILGKAHFPEWRKMPVLDPSIHQRCFQDHTQFFHPSGDG